MARYKVELAYDGTHFSGFQRQVFRSKIRTVQGEIERGLSALGWKGRSILAAGRTDTGVHASGQVITFDLDWKHSKEALKEALNANLPQDVAAEGIVVAEFDFHPRYDAVARRYQYRIYCQNTRDPLRDRFAWRVWPEVDLDLLQQAADIILGEHNFKAFGTSAQESGTTSRLVYVSRWMADGDNLVYEIEANGFLYHMVRRLVKIQVSIGQRKLDIDFLTGLLCGYASAMTMGLAPPRGLTLVKVIYAI